MQTFIKNSTTNHILSTLVDNDDIVFEILVYT